MRRSRSFKYYWLQIPDLYLLDDPAESNRRSLELSFYNLGSQGWDLCGRWENFFIFKREL